MFEDRVKNVGRRPPGPYGRRVPDASSPCGALVLVVEDEPRIAEVLEAYLRRDGFGTARAGDGPAALRLHERLRPDLVLLDVMLPGLDGFEVLRRLRADAARPSTPVILLTARDEDVDKLVGLRMGADDYVVKPFSPPEVIARRSRPACCGAPTRAAGCSATSPPWPRRWTTSRPSAGWGRRPSRTSCAPR